VASSEVLLTQTSKNIGYIPSSYEIKVQRDRSVTGTENLKTNASCSAMEVEMRLNLLLFSRHDITRLLHTKCLNLLSRGRSEANGRHNDTFHYELNEASFTNLL